jgi:hypothetical protein
MKGKGFWKRCKSGFSSLTHNGEQYVPFIGDLDMVGRPGKAPIEGPHLPCHLQLLPSQGFKHLLTAVSPYKPQTRGPVGAHPGPYEFATDPWIRTLHSLHSWATSQAHTLTQHSASTLLPEHERHSFTPKGRLLGCLCLWELIKLPFCLLRQAQI